MIVLFFAASMKAVPDPVSLPNRSRPPWFAHRRRVSLTPPLRLYPHKRRRYRQSRIKQQKQTKTRLLFMYRSAHIKIYLFPRLFP